MANYDAVDVPNTDGMNRIGVSGAGFSNNMATGRLQDVLTDMNQPLLLNLGCGLDIRDGFVNIDLYSDNPRVVRMDIRKLELPDNAADLILASDVLEHFSHRQVDDVLKEWFRVLKPNGQIIIRCPSLRLQMKAYVEKKWNADVASYMIFGGQTNPGDYHCIGFDENSIKNHLAKAGFSVTEFEEIDTPQDNGFINLNMTIKAVKPTNVQKVANETNNTGRNIQPIDGKYLNIVWEGSQFVYNSLALVNREICKNLIDAGVANVTIIPFEPDDENILKIVDKNPDLKKLKENDIRYKADVSKEIENLPYAWIRHQWPPKDEVPQGAKWFIMQPFEFNRCTNNFVQIFNKADELWTPTNYSRQAFLNSNIDGDKVQLIPNGCNPLLFKPYGEKYKLKTNKKFKFLYVGGTIYRKGIDILLEAYLKSFTNEDDVCLIIKDIAVNKQYKGINFSDSIKQIAARPDIPEIEYIDDEITEEEMAALYRACDVFVSPYRGEGFSLPTLEAMACGLPVVVTKGGATDDFTTDESAWYISAEWKECNPSDFTDLEETLMLLEPNQEELQQTMQFLFKNPLYNTRMGLIGSYIARSKWTWKQATMKVLARLDAIYNTNMAFDAAKKLQENKDDYILIGEAELAFGNGDYERAEQFFVLAAEHDTLEVQYLCHTFLRLAQISLARERIIDAYKYIEAVRGLDNSHPDAAYLSAKLLAAEKKYDDALDCLTPIVSEWEQEYKYRSTTANDLEQYLLLIADILFELDDIERASQVYRSALKYNNYSSDACYGLGMCYLLADMKAEAKEMFEWTLKYNSAHSQAEKELSKLT